ncbi:MAG TPA: radical SAM protein [Labilithrix sp.]|nr:radical SAM protein [Labilithrix sp.]
MPRFLPVSNPQNRFVSTAMEYDDGEAPGAELEVHEDHSKSILSTNDSPDVGFRWSVNPYRGCFHGCAYCLDGDTPILMGDGRTRALRDVRVGDGIYGTGVDGCYRRYTRTRVLAHWQTVKHAYRVVLADGTEIVASADHRFLTNRGWKHVTGTEQGAERRPFLTAGNYLVGTGRFANAETPSPEYERGYLCGMIRGDALLKTFHYQREGRTHGDQHQFRLALIDFEALLRTRAYLQRSEVETPEFVFKEASGNYARMEGIRTYARGNVERIRSIVEWPSSPTRDWRRGFLAGIFDAEGSRSRGILRISNSDESILTATSDCFRAFGFDTILEPPGPGKVVSNIRLRGGLREQLRFAHLTDPAIRRKWDMVGGALKQPKRLQVVAVEKLGFDLLMFDITTGTGDFIANGVVSHNCYARPSHEYLSLGAGTDFERKIVVKRRAPELLRESFDKKSWKGELIVFSGITDCYQPLESKLRLTRGCLEVCAEYRNPVGIITKSPVVERDIDVLQELARVASVRVSVSVPFWDPDVAKAMEPMVTTPDRRMKIVETLAKAGIPVGVSVSPIVPGLNDDHLGDVIERARDAGARHAFYVLLRLPGPVTEVFENALREKLPLRAEKVLRRLREAYGGKLYDSTYGTRGRGDGVYAETIRKLFERTTKRCGLNADEMLQYETPSTFRRPAKHGQTSFDF